MIIDKKGWKKVSFGDVCKNLNQSESDPLSKGIDRFVGLEHIESGNLHVTNWGSVSEGTTFTKKFSKGHVLFGKRRAYLKKAALADFDGICSGDILVFEANEKVICKNLLPFLVSSERFFDHAVQTSAGSLSPRTKFQDLANFEFLLPPLEQQAKLAELLWAGHEVLQSKIKLQHVAMCYLTAALNSIYEEEKYHKYFKKFNSQTKGKQWESTRLDALSLKIGDGIHKTPKYSTKTQYFFINGNNLFEEGIKITENTKCVSKSEYEKYLLSLPFNTVLMSINGTIGNLSFYNDEQVILGKSVAFISPNITKLNPTFLYYFLQTKRVRQFYQRELTGTTISNLSLKTIRATPIDLPDITEQSIMVDTIEKIHNVVKTTIQSVEEFRQVQKQLINQIFG
jgi:type I restriction enzyme, S subunit